MSKNSPDYITPLLEKAPAAWALIRANEIRNLDGVNFKHPILDVGCGDGLVAKVLMSGKKEKFDWGIDLSEREIKKAKKLKVYMNCIAANVYSLPFEDKTFSTVFSNSVIEHIPQLDRALSEISRVIKIGGELVITVPSSYLAGYLLGTQIFGKWYGKFFNKLFKHYNLYTHKGWERVLKKHSLKLKYHRYYHTSGMIKVHELFSFVALPIHLLKPLVGFWPVFPGLRKVLVVPWMRRFFYKFCLEDVKKDQGGSLLLVAVKK